MIEDNENYYDDLISTSEIAEKPNKENNANVSYSFPKYVEKLNYKTIFGINEYLNTEIFEWKSNIIESNFKIRNDSKESPTDFKIIPDKILTDKRTTCMIKNIPNKFTVKNLIEFINETHFCKYDFLYLRMDFKNNCNVGYAFINFIDQKSIIEFYNRINGKRWKNVASVKIAELTYASVQGLDNLINKFKKSTVIMEEERFRPKVFYIKGEKRGEERKDVF